MEIYKLNDELSSKTDTNILRITDIRQAVKNPERVNVFVNGKYSFSLDVAQLVDLKLKVGTEISEEELMEYKKASEFGKLYQRTLEWVLVRPRSIKEAKDYLYKKIHEKKLEKDYLNSIIEKLESKNYLDDLRFAEWYAENRFVKKGISARRLKVELIKKGIDKEIIEKVLCDSGRNDEEEIKKIIVKKRARYDDEKLTQYLCRQGFSYELVQNLVRSCGKD